MTGEKFVDVDGVRTRYYERGAGPVVVLFHGGHFGSHDAADSADDWSLNFDGLAHWFHVYAIDKIGPNRSEAARAVLERGLDGWTPSPEGEPRKPSGRYRLKS